MDILKRIEAYDCSDGGHCDAAEGSAYDLMNDAADEIRQLRAVLRIALDMEVEAGGPYHTAAAHGEKAGGNDGA